MVNEMHKLFLKFEMQTDPLISARRPDLITINKKKRKLYGPGGPLSKTFKKWKEW